MPAFARACPVEKSGGCQDAEIYITSPQVPKASTIVASGNWIDLSYRVSADISTVKIKVSNGPNAASRIAGREDARVFLFQGANTIDLFGLQGAAVDKDAHVAIKVVCSRDLGFWR